MFQEHVYEMKPNIFFSLVSLQGEVDGKRVGRKGERGRRIFQTGLQGLLSLGHTVVHGVTVVAQWKLRFTVYSTIVYRTFEQCCGSEMIYSGSGSSFEFSEFRIQPILLSIFRNNKNTP